MIKNLHRHKMLSTTKRLFSHLIFRSRIKPYLCLLDKATLSRDTVVMDNLLATFLPESFSLYMIFDLTIAQWIRIFLVILIGVLSSALLSHGVQWLVVRAFNLNRWRKKYDYDVSSLSLSRPLNLIILGSFFSLSLSIISAPDHIKLVLGIASKLLVFAGISWLGLHMADTIQILLKKRAQTTETTFDDLLAPLVGRTLRIMVSVFIVISLAEMFNLPLSSVIAGIGIGGIAIAMAAKETIANVFGSVTILIDRPFTIGDWVIIGDVEGTVEELGFRSTRVRTFYNSVVTLPNALLLTSVVDNMGQRKYRRIKETLALTYDTPPEKIRTFCKEIKKIIQDHPDSRKDFMLVNFTSFGESSLSILIYAFVDVPDWERELAAKQDILLSIYTLAQTMDVRFAYPTQSLFIEALPKGKH
jgi:MscS family membrane protein